MPCKKFTISSTEFYLCTCKSTRDDFHACFCDILETRFMLFQEKIAVCYIRPAGGNPKLPLGNNCFSKNWWVYLFWTIPYIQSHSKLSTFHFFASVSPVTIVLSKFSVFFQRWRIHQLQTLIYVATALHLLEFSFARSVTICYIQKKTRKPRLFFTPAAIVRTNNLPRISAFTLTRSCKM